MTTTLFTPLQVHGVRTDVEYRQAQRDHLLRLRQSRPSLAVREPWRAQERPPVIVSGGKWLVRCACGNAPSVAPEWRLALCFECGAVYEDLAMPEGQTEISAALLERQSASQRHWTPGETAADLRAENRRNGVKSNGLD